MNNPKALSLLIAKAVKSNHKVVFFEPGRSAYIPTDEALVEIIEPLLEQGLGDAVERNQAPPKAYMDEHGDVVRADRLGMISAPQQQYTTPLVVRLPKEAPIAWMYPSGRTDHPIHLTLEKDIAYDECSDKALIVPLVPQAAKEAPPDVITAGKALIERWKDVPHTAEFVHALRDAIERHEASAPPKEEVSQEIVEAGNAMATHIQWEIDCLIDDNKPISAKRPQKLLSDWDAALSSPGHQQKGEGVAVRTAGLSAVSSASQKDAAAIPNANPGSDNEKP